MGSTSACSLSNASRSPSPYSTIDSSRFILRAAFSSPADFGQHEPLRTSLEPYYQPVTSCGTESGRSPPSPSHRYPRPHPPAPPAPPRPPQFRPAFETTGPPPSLTPTFTYYRQQTEYDSTRPITTHDSRPSTAAGSYNESIQTSSRDRSHGSSNGHPEETTSTLDPDRLREWEQAQEQGRSASRARYASSGSASGSNTMDADDHDEFGGYMDDELEGQGLDPQLDERGLVISDYGNRLMNTEYYPGAHHQAQFEDIRRETGSVDECEARGLNRLQDCDPKVRPAYPIPTIIKCAIGGSPRERLTLSELYLAMEKRFPYYTTVNNKSWRNSVRHNLSLNNQFEQEERQDTEPGKGHYWVVAKDKPQGNKRPRKRNKQLGKRALAQMALEAAQKQLQESGQNPGPESASAPSPNSTPPAGESSPFSSSGSIPIDPSLLKVGAAIPYAAAFSRTHGTLPANAGSYAAVTGMLSAPAPLDRQYYTAWDGSAAAVAAAQVPGVTIAHEDSGSGAPVQGVSVLGQTQSSVRGGGTSPSHPTPTPPPSQFSTTITVTTSRRGAGSKSKSAIPPSESTSGVVGPHRSQPTRSQRRYDPTSATETASSDKTYTAGAPKDTFNALAAQIEREGTGARGSGGPGLAVSRARRAKAMGRKGKSKDRENRDQEESESEDEEVEDDSDDYRPGGRRGRR